MKSQIRTLVIFCLFVTACTQPFPTPIVNKQPETQVPPSLTPSLPTATVPPTTVSTTAPVTSASSTPAPFHKNSISQQNIEQVVLLNRLGKGLVNGIAYAPDGKSLAVVTTQGVYLYDAQKLEEIASSPSAGDISPYQIAFNRQGGLLAIGELQEDVCKLVLWRLSEGAWQQVGQVEAFVECLAEALSPDGEYLASANYDTRLVTVWRTSDLAQMRTFPLEYPGDIFSIFVQLAFSGKSTLAIGEESYVSVYDLQTGQLLNRLKEPGMTALNRLAISRYGQVLAARDQASSKILIWNLDGGEALTLEDAYQDWLMGEILLSSGGEIIASMHTDPSGGGPAGWIDVWRTSDGVALVSLTSPGWFSSPGMTFSPDGSMLITRNNGVEFWQASDGTLLNSLSGFTGVDGILAPDGALLANATSQQIQLYRLSDGQALQTLEEEQGYFGPGVVAFSPDGRLLVSKRIPGKINLWGVADGILKETLEYNCSTPESISNEVLFSPDGQYLAVYAYSSICRGIAVWRVSDGDRLYEFDGSGGDSFAISPDGEILVVEDERAGTIAFARIQDGSTIQTIERPREASEDGRILSSFSPDSRFYAVGATNGGVKVWKIGVDTPLYTLTSPFEWTALSFSPDGKRLILASDSIQIFNATDGTLLSTLEGQSTIGEGGLFSPDGRIMVTTDGESVNLWSVGDGTLVHTLEAQLPAVFSPAGTILVTSGEGLVQFWSTGDGALLRTVKASTLPVGFSADGRLLISKAGGVVETWGAATP